MGIGIIQHIPLAALDDILQLVVPILFMIIYVVGQLLANKKPDRPRPKLPDSLQPNRQPPEPGPRHEMAGRAEIARKARVAGKAEGGQAAGVPIRREEALRVEVEEFLRRAQGKPRPRQGQSQRPDEVPPAPDRSRGSIDRTRQGKTPPHQGIQPGQRADRHPRAPAHTAMQSQLTAPKPSKPSEQPAQSLSIAEHVAAHVGEGSRDIGRHAEHLVDELAQTDERTEARLHQKFDHAVGRLQREEIAVRDSSSGLAQEISELLTKPEGIRQLILANEILRRPHF